jgi:hypothetical protein
MGITMSGLCDGCCLDVLYYSFRFGICRGWISIDNALIIPSSLFQVNLDSE